ncbi:MAG: hypothetical protein QOI83_4127, partial [Streptomycetaceae bacterium]|nr:hypothetical protein [Streptomycetaceae bacterium]
MSGTIRTACSYLGLRLGQALIALWGVTTAVFFALR